MSKEWPSGLKKILDTHNCSSLVELVKKLGQKKEQAKEEPLRRPKTRLPYKDVDDSEIPD